MSTQSAYNQMAKRNVSSDVETETKEDHEERLLQESTLKTWLDLAKTKELLIFLAWRELDLLNSARNCSNLINNSENIAKNLHISMGIREVINYITIGKQSQVNNQQNYKLC